MVKTAIYNGLEITRNIPLNYSEIRGKDYFIITKDQVPKIYLCQLNNAYVTPYGVVYKNWKVVQESVFQGFYSQNYYLTLIKKIFLRRVKRIKGISIIATHAYFNNYYHFTTECLPRLFILKEYSKETQLLVHESLPHFAKECIRLLGYKNVEYIKDTELIYTEKLIFCTHVANTHGHNPLVLAKLIPFLKAKVDLLTSTYSTFKNIYISRSKANSRKLVNEDKVITLVEAYDFKVIYLEDLTIEDQIVLFSNVKNIISVHGAGTTNIMFMSEGGLLIELINEDHYAPFFFNLANILNHDTIYIQGVAQPNTKNPIRDNFLINICELKYHLDNNLK